jgi:hypothetical protein
MTNGSGARIGPYEIVDQIGVGGMGEVYRATDTNLRAVSFIRRVDRRPRRSMA